MKIDNRILSRVLDTKSRNVSNTERGERIKSRLDSISNSFDALKESFKRDEELTELLRYFPTALVALFQGFCSLAIRDLIDSHETFSHNISRISDVQFKLESVIAFQNKTVSMGDTISNILPLSTPEAAYSHLNKLTNDQFLNDVKQYELKCPSCKVEHTPLQMAPAMFADIEEIFAFRNILCHEVGDMVNIKPATIEKWLFSVGLFLLVSDNVIFNICAKEKIGFDYKEQYLRQLSG